MTRFMKAISPIISIIILLLITITIAGAGYSYLSVYWTGITGKQLQLLDSYCTGTQANIILRGAGTAPINNSDHEAMLGLFEQDENTVGMWRFDESDGNASLDSSGQGNTGTIYGNTVLLMNFDENDGNATLDSTSYGSTGSIFGDTVLLMHFDNGSGATTNDETSYGNDGTLQGDLETSGWKTSGCQSGSCLEFDGEGDYVDLPTTDSLNHSNSEEWTFSAWVYPLNFPSYGTIFSSADGFHFNGIEFHLWNDGRMAFRIANSTNSESKSSISSISLNEWSHIVAVYSDSADNVTFYYNGDKDSEKSFSTLLNQEGISNSVYIGWGVWSAYSWWNGSMDEVAVYSKALSQEEVETLYQAGKAKFIERKPGRSGNAMKFDGDGDYIDLTGLEVSTAAGDNTTVAFWMNWSGGNTGMPFGWSYYDLWLSNGNFGFNSANGDIWGVSSSGFANRWVHVAAIFYNGVINNSRLFIDGMEQTCSQKQGTPSSRTVGSSARISSWINGVNYGFNGIIDEVAIYSRTLTADEVKAHYEAGKAKFIEHVQGRFGYGMEFDGDGDYVDVGNDESLNLTTAMTLSTWIKYTRTGLDSIAYIITKSKYTGTNTNRAYTLSVQNDGAVSIAVHNSSGTVFSTGYDGDYHDGNWHHIVGTWENNNLSLYVDGISVNSATTEGDFGTSTNSVRIGGWDGTYRPFNGTIDEVLIFNRTLTPEEIQAQLKPACSCSGNTCQCGELTVSKTSGEGYFHPYFDNETLSPGQTLTMTDYNCLGGRCEYRITSPAGSYEAVVFCS